MNFFGLSLLVILAACGSNDSEQSAVDSGIGPLDGSVTDGGNALDGDVADADNRPFSPFFADDFESYVDVESLNAGNPFTTAERTVASTTEAFSGTVSAKMEIRSVDSGGGFGKWGGALSLEPTLKKGSEVWVRLRVFWPSSFEFSASPWMKFLRIHNRNEDGSNDGWNDIYIDNPDGNGTTFRTIKEKHDVWETDDGTPLPRDTWQSYEMYLYADNVPVDMGGKGRMRMWKNNEIVFDRTDVPTLETPGSMRWWLSVNQS